MILQLPFPPSVNKYWRHPTTGKLAGRHLISEHGRAYREAVRSIFHGWPSACLVHRPITGPVVVDIEAFMPDRRRRDLDNLLKGLLDSLTHAGVWEDDNQVVDLRIRKAAEIGGMVKVKITEAA